MSKCKIVREVKAVKDCLFCRIARREAPAEIILETEEVLVFRDINPVAPTHLLVIPKDMWAIS